MQFRIERRGRLGEPRHRDSAQLRQGHGGFKARRSSFIHHHRSRRCSRKGNMKPRTIIEKIWDNHIVAERPNAPTLLYIDLHLVHEVTSPQAFDGLRARGLKVRRPDLTIATTDHSTPTTPRSFPIVDKVAAAQVARLEASCEEFGIRCFGLSSDKQGIVHVIGPEQWLTQPDMTVVCGDSHTATHGPFAALALGIATPDASD